MKKLFQPFLYLTIAGFLLPGSALAQEMSNYELMQEIRAMKARVETLEASLQQKNREVKALRQQVAEKSGGTDQGLGERVSRIEEKMEEEETLHALGEWADRIHLSGAVEVEAAYEDMDFADPNVEDTDASDISLATVELGVDADIAEHVQGHVLFLWEDGAGGVDVDEGFITIDGKDVVPLYLNAGKLYVPFGSFESHFVSDPLTLEIGETNEHAVQVGFANDWMDLSAAVYNGDVNEINDQDDHIDGFVGSAVLTLPEGLVPDLGLRAGVSYISNIAESDGLEGETPGVLRDDVGGLGAFLSASYMERVFFEAEYIAALDSFEAGELTFDNGRRAEPRAWNLELAFAPMEKLELGVRYEGSDDMNDFLPETQFGGVVSYEVFKYTTLSLEYLHGTFENDDERDLITTQFAIEF
ncbi:MAG: LbtU family siderophore porin [Desulfobacteraceae bacterium]|jgi:hypothetical protein